MDRKTAFYRWVVSVRLWAAVLAAGAFIRVAAFGLRRIRIRQRLLRDRWVQLGPERFHSSAREYINLTPDGWDVRTKHPGHYFAAWEMAVRYEAACREARHRHEQLRGMPASSEVDALIRRISDLLAEAELLSRIEQTMRPVVDTNADTSGVLAGYPHTAPSLFQLPRQARLRSLACKHLKDILPKLRQVLDMQHQGEAFHPEVFSLLLQADRQIPGPGTHTAIWDGKRSYRYPFNEDYESVLRPLRYIPAELQNGYDNSLHSRYIIMTTGGYLEGCIKTALRDTGTRRGKLRKPLGTMIARGFLKDLLNPSETACLQQIARIAVNPAKHDFINDHGPESLFSYEDAVYAYFLSRRFGAIILEAAGSMPRIDAAVQSAIRNGSYFWGVSLSPGVEPPHNQLPDNC
ncbi:MAG: hypothetical protein OXI96_08370 [Acidimicrobiaceae bacterium]|nr:hypothetical protein [Acidimicrobiaceae bacterium]